MALRYKISILAAAAVLVVLIPMSLIYIRALAKAEEEEIQVRLRTTGGLMTTGLFANELESESVARQHIFLRSALDVDKAILFIAVYPGGIEGGVAVLDRTRFPQQLKGSDWELIQQFVEEHTDPVVKYVSVILPRDRQLLMGYSIGDIERRRLIRQLQAIGWGIGLTFLAVAGSVFFARRLTQPIRDLAFGMSRVANGNLEVRLERQTGDEIGALTQDFNQMVADLQENVLERQRMSHELDIARRIQQGLLPQSEPEIPGLDISGICLTYAEVGGDYYDYVYLKDGRLAIAIGDVFGHGVSSGLLAAAVQGCLHNQVSTDPAASEVLAAVDRVVRSSGNQLMTLCYAVMDPHNGLATVASAGHWPPYHYTARTDMAEPAHSYEAAAPALGAFPADAYPDHQVSLESGDILAFYSDGILETLSPDREMYGEERFCDAIRRHAGSTAREIRDAILDEVNHLRGEMSQEDDIALVIVKYEASS